MTQKDKFMVLVSKDKTNTMERNKERIKNRARTRESQGIALKVLMRLDELGWSQKDLAKAMDVSPQQISKIVKGKENLTLDSQIKLQTVLDIPILASYYDKSKSKIKTISFPKQTAKYNKPRVIIDSSYNELIKGGKLEQEYSIGVFTLSQIQENRAQC